MSKEQRNETPGKAPVKLTPAERKEIQAVIRRYKGDDASPIPPRRAYPMRPCTRTACAG